MAKHIPFIHNYCDRWCERCCYTASCALYENESNEQAGAENNIWDGVAKNLSDAHDLLAKMAAEQGIDLNNIPQEELDKINEEREQQKRHVKEDEFVKLCADYTWRTRDVLANEALWKQKGDEMMQQEKFGTLTLEELEDQLKLMKECREIIQWYHFFIQVKFMRATSGLMHGLEPEEKGSFQTDSNGSAKIALIALERSRLAWTQLFTLIPEEDVVLPILSLLSRIEKAATEKFPNAKKFIRPGFDEIEKIEIPDSRFTPKPGTFIEFQNRKRI